MKNVSLERGTNNMKRALYAAVILCSFLAVTFLPSGNNAYAIVEEDSSSPPGQEETTPQFASDHLTVSNLQGWPIAPWGQQGVFSSYNSFVVGDVGFTSGKEAVTATVQGTLEVRSHDGLLLLEVDPIGYLAPPQTTFPVWAILMGMDSRK